MWNDVESSATFSDIISKHFTEVSQESCSICLSQKNKFSILLPCEHSFCRDCITQWLNMNKICPLCKTPPINVLLNIKSPTNFILQPVLKSSSSFSESDDSHLFLRDVFLTTGWTANSRINRNLIYIFNFNPQSTDDLPTISPEYYATNEASLFRLRLFLRRELPILAPWTYSLESTGPQFNDYLLKALSRVEMLLKTVPLSHEKDFLSRFNCIVSGLSEGDSTRFLRELRFFANDLRTLEQYDADVCEIYDSLLIDGESHLREYLRDKLSTHPLGTEYPEIRSVFDYGSMANVDLRNSFILKMFAVVRILDTHLQNPSSVIFKKALHRYAKYMVQCLRRHFYFRNSLEGPLRPYPLENYLGVHLMAQGAANGQVVAINSDSSSLSSSSDSIATITQIIPRRRQLRRRQNRRSHNEHLSTSVVLLSD